MISRRGADAPCGRLLLGHTKIVIGASGSGKSTILKIILGLLMITAGRSRAGTVKRACLAQEGLT